MLENNAVVADEVSPPVSIATSNVDGATLAIPRWKGYMSESNPNNFWLTYAQSGSDDGNISYTSDGGETWNSNVFQVSDNGGLDMHASLFGMNGSLYYTWPASGIHFRKINPPANDNSDREPVRTIPGGTSGHRSNVMVEESGRVWVFTRQTGDPGENVLYHYSDDDGANWTNGVAFSTGVQGVRIGSMPYIGGAPALVVFYMYEPQGYEYYLWNGSSFEARPDHSIYAVDMGEARVFTHNVVDDTTMHLIFGYGNNLYHIWKNYAGGQGNWNNQVIDTSPNTRDNDWFTASVVRGDALFLFYTKKSSSDFATSRVYYKRWDQPSQSWSQPILVSAQIGYNRDPNTCFQVPASAGYIPVFWNAGTGGQRTVYFAKIILDGGGELDTIPPATVNDLGSVEGVEQAEGLFWTSTGDNARAGMMGPCEIAYWTDKIAEESRAGAWFADNPPHPLAGSEPQSCILKGLDRGQIYHVACKSCDIADNLSAMSNLSEGVAGVFMLLTPFWQQ
jgi:hypothetical protein